MEPDSLAAVSADEQRAVIEVNEECLHMQGHVPKVVGEGPGHPRRALPTWLLALLIAAALAALGWWITGAL